MTKELSIKSIKEELMDALLGDMRIINSFGGKEVRKVREYIGTNIFGYLNENASCGYTDTYINFDVMKNRGCYDVFIILKMHKDLVKNEAVNGLDDISECIEEIVNELFPYHKSYSDVPVDVVSDDYVRRNIKFTLRPIDKDGYEKSLEDSEKENVDHWKEFLDWTERVTRCVEEWEHDKGIFSIGNFDKCMFTIDNNGCIKVSDGLLTGTISDKNKE